MIQPVIKIVIFNCADNRYAADIYIDNERVFCSDGQSTTIAALDEVIKYFNKFRS